MYNLYSTFDYLTKVIVSIDYTNCLLNSRLIYVDTFGNPYAKNVDERAAWIKKMF